MTDKTVSMGFEEQTRSDHSALRRLNTRVEDVARVVAVTACACILIIAFATVIDVILRNLGDSTLFGLNEITVLLIAVAAATSLPYGVARGSILAITMLRDRLAPATAQWCVVMSGLFLLIFFALVAWRVGDSALTAWQRGTTTVINDFPKGPFYGAMALGLGLAALVQFVRSLDAIAEALRLTPGPRGIATLALLLGFAALLVASVTGMLGRDALKMVFPADRIVLCAVMFVLMWVLILMSVPIGISMGIIGIVGTATALMPKISINVIGPEVTGFITRDSLSVLPIFLLMGAFANLAGIGTDLYRLANALLGHLRGGLAYASIVACAGFGMLTGSSVATQMSIGRLALFEMRDRGYSQELSAGSIAAGGTLGQLIPPSGALIIYAILTEQSVGQLFIGALIPGILATLLYMSAVTVWLMINPSHAVSAKFSGFREIFEASKASWSVILLLVVVLGGIYSGFFTELEAGSVGTVGAFLIALARGKITFGTLTRTLGDSTGSMSMMYTLIFGVTMLSFFFGVVGISDAFVVWVDSLGLPNWGVILCLVLCYLVLGTVMDAYAMMIITIPIFVPVVMNMGYDPIWWGLMTLVCMEAGQISPPFGLNIFVINALDEKMPIQKVYKGAWPFFFSSIVKIVLLMLFPEIVTWLPSTM